MSGKVILTVGVPASGKTTWAKQQAAVNENVVIVSRDDIRAAHGWESGQHENRVTKIQRGQIEIALRDGHDVIVADTNITKGLRENLIKFCHEHGADVQLVLFYTGPKVAIERDLRRERSVGAEVINKMWAKFKAQTWDELEFPVRKFDAYTNSGSKPEIIVVDIDGTLAKNVSGRKFYDESRVGEDEYVRHVAMATIAVAEHWEVPIIVVSGRSENCRTETIEWLARHDYPYTDLIMRKAGDYRPDWVVKNEIYDEHILPYFDVLMAFDDRDQVVRHVRARGVPVAQVADGRF